MGRGNGRQKLATAALIISVVGLIGIGATGGQQQNGGPRTPPDAEVVAHVPPSKFAPLELSNRAFTASYFYTSAIRGVWYAFDENESQTSPIWNCGMPLRASLGHRGKHARH